MIIMKLEDICKENHAFEFCAGIFCGWLTETIGPEHAMRNALAATAVYGGIMCIAREDVRSGVEMGIYFGIGASAGIALKKYVLG